jgi:hypothetical protein
MPSSIRRTLLVSMVVAVSAGGFAPTGDAADAPAAKKPTQSPKKAQAATAHPKAIQKPKKGKFATAPPAGAKVVKDRSLPKGLKWKTDQETRSVFAVTPDKSKDGQVWFIDPETGWAYTIEKPGNVLVANPQTGAIYDRGPLSGWAGDLLYFFAFWDVDGPGGTATTGRAFSMPKAERFVAIYDDPRVQSYDSTAAY